MGDIVTLVAEANARGPTSGFTDIADNEVQLPLGFDSESAKIFRSLKVGDLILKHRIVHAALGRSRSAHATESPLAAEYFSQRTTEGALMISQATNIGPEWIAWPWAAGLESPDQVDAFKKTINAVHERGGFWFQQLSHVGRCTSPALVKRARDLAGLPHPPLYGYRPVSSSAVPESGINTHSGEAFGIPHALTIEEVHRIRDAFKQTSQTALDTGADGIEILAGNGFLLDQFLHDNINQRTDEYGGSVENRSRLVLEVVDAVADVIGFQRIGVRMSPFSNFHETDGSQPLEQVLHLCSQLALRGIAYIHLAEGRVSRNLDIAENLERLNRKGIAPEDISLAPFRRLLDNTSPRNPKLTPTILIGNGGYTGVTGLLTVEEGRADAVSFGRRFISNPDLVQRLRQGNPLAPYDRSTFYTHGAKGYVTYPNYEPEDLAVSEEIAAEAAGQHEVPADEHDKATGRVAIIGAGVSGILTAEAFNRVGGFQMDIFERRSMPGGSWVYDQKPTAVPQFPAVHPGDINPPLTRPAGNLPLNAQRSIQQRFLTTPMYQALEANIPWSVMAGDTIFQSSASTKAEHSPFLSGSEVSAAVSKVSHDFDHLIQYHTTVEDVVKLQDGTVQLLLRHENDDGTDTWFDRVYDHVVVATGHNSIPRVPDIPGLSTWKGALRHSVTWRSGEDFRDQRILVVGSSESAIDLCIYSKTHVKGLIYVSQRKPHPRFPDVFEHHGMRVVSTIDKIAESEIHLTDGTVLENIDTIVFATGYFYSYPFLSNVRPPETPCGYRVPGLYQHIFDIHNPDTIAFVGVINGSLAWRTWEKSAYLAALLWAGKIHLPPKNVQEEWEQKRLKDVGESRFHVLPTQPDRVLFWDEINELASEYLSSGALDDGLLRGFPYEWVLQLLGSRDSKLRHYGLPLDSKGAKNPLSV